MRKMARGGQGEGGEGGAWGPARREWGRRERGRGRMGRGDVEGRGSARREKGGGRKLDGRSEIVRGGGGWKWEMNRQGGGRERS